MKIGINGFGRIGRTIARANLHYYGCELIAVNDTCTSAKNMAYLLKYDSTYGRLEQNVSCDDDHLIIDGHKTNYSSHGNIEDADWSGCDVVFDCSGIARNVEAGQKVADKYGCKVIVTHSSKHVDNEIIMGVNEGDLKVGDRVISNSICDANAIAHVLKWFNDDFGIVGGSVTTLHPWLSYQNLVDGKSISQSDPNAAWDDFALGRSSVGTLIPKNTTAVTATEKIIPEIADKLMSLSYRIPTHVVTSSDITLKLDRAISAEELKTYLGDKIDSSRFVSSNFESLTSKDYEKLSASACVDMQWAKAKGDMVKLVVWYDNEWGYSCRAIDLAKHAIST